MNAPLEPTASTKASIVPSTRHWQDFTGPVTLCASQAGEFYRAATGIKTALTLIADNNPRRYSDNEYLSGNEVDALLAGALALINLIRDDLEELHQGSQP